MSGSNKRERVQLTFCDMSEQYNNNCSRQPKSNTLGRVLRGRVAGAGHGHGKHVGLLAHDTLWSANEPKTAGRNCEPRRCPQLPLTFCPLFLSLTPVLPLPLYLLGNCRVNFGLDFRLCQILNIDYLETYSAISKSTRLRLVWHKLHVHLPHGKCLSFCLILLSSSLVSSVSASVSVSTSDCAINDNYQKCQKHFMSKCECVLSLNMTADRLEQDTELTQYV